MSDIEKVAEKYTVIDASGDETIPVIIKMDEKTGPTGPDSIEIGYSMYSNQGPTGIQIDICAEELNNPDKS